MGAKGSTEKGSTEILLDKQKPNYNSIDMDDRFSYLEKQVQMICEDLTSEEILEYFDSKIRIEQNIREKIKTIISYIEAKDEKTYLKKLKQEEGMSDADIVKELTLFYYVKCGNNLAKKERENSNLRHFRHIFGNFAPTYMTLDFKSTRKSKKSNKKIKKSQKSYRKVKKSVKSIKKRNIKH
jgi:translation initiation factor 1 (eIF-1/SUI1)